MKEIELIEKLNNENNFHLSLKVIQISDDELMYKLKNKLDTLNKSSIIITNIDEVYVKTKEAYTSKIDYVLCNESISFLLPLCIVITKDVTSLIKPMIPVFYYLKDNKIIQHVKTSCNKKSVSYEALKNHDELIDRIIEEVVYEKS